MRMKKILLTALLACLVLLGGCSQMCIRDSC